MSKWQEEKAPIGLRMIVAAGSKFLRKGAMRVICSKEDYNGEGWLHVSVSCYDRLPTWDEVKIVRDEFFPENAEVFQILPPKDHWLNLHKNCFHLWSRIGNPVCPEIWKHPKIG